MDTKLEWKDSDDLKFIEAQVTPEFKYLLIKSIDEYIACYVSGTGHKVMGYLVPHQTIRESLESAKARCEAHRNRLLIEEQS